MASGDSSIGSNGQLFAHLSGDSRLHIWDVASKKLRKSYVEKNHLSHSFTCFSWGKSTKDSPGMFAVGFSDGIVVVWDLSRGVVAKAIGTANESEAPTSVAFSNDEKSIFVCTNQNHIAQYDIASGNEVQSLKTGKKAVQKVAMNPKVDVIAAASSSIRIVDVASGRKRKLEAAFSGGVTALAFTPCGRFLVASSARTRELLVFDARADSGSDAPVYVLPVRGVLTSVDTRTSSDRKIIQLLGTFEDSGACYFELNAQYSKDGANGVNGVTETNLITTQAILCGHLGNVGNRESGGALLVLGSKSSPVFRYVELSGHEREIVVAEVGAKTDAAVQLNGAGQGKESGEGALFAPEVLGPNEMGGVKRPQLGSENGAESAEPKSKRSKGGADALIVASSDKQEQSLEARLESLSRSLTQLEDQAEKSGANSSNKATVAPTSDSLVTLIDQALQSGDDGLLEQCLSCADGDVVEATARRLPTARVVMFLRKLVAKFEKRPSRGGLLTQWLSSLLRNHTAYLVTVPDLSYQLAGLSQMLEQRLSSYSKLSSLAGRLDLLMSQVNYRSNSVTNASEALGGAARGQHQQPVIVPAQVYQEE